MNSQIEQLAKKAGFIFWKDESYGPGPHHIDWGCDYHEEFDTFVKLLIDECAKVANNKYDQGRCPVGNFIKEHFKV